MEDIQDAIRRTPKTPRELAEELDLKLATVYKTCKRGVQAKMLIKLESGKIALKADV